MWTYYVYWNLWTLVVTDIQTDKHKCFVLRHYNTIATVQDVPGHLYDSCWLAYCISLVDTFWYLLTHAKMHGYFLGLCSLLADNLLILIVYMYIYMFDAFGFMWTLSDNCGHRWFCGQFLKNRETQNYMKKWF